MVESPFVSSEESSGKGLTVKDQALPSAVETAINKIPDGDARASVRATLSTAFSFSRTSFGPDPETVKILAETETHQESCRLEAYKNTLTTRDKQSERDHDFRQQKLKHQTVLTVLVLLVSAALIGFGIYIYTSTNNAVGGYLIVGGAAILLNALGVKLPSSPKE